MKNFDDFSRKKKPDPSLASEGLSVKDDGKPIHRDIQRKRKQVSLVSKNSLTHAKHTASRNTKEHMGDWMRSVQAFFTNMTLLQMCVILCVCFLGFVVYGLGFMLRTEKNITTWMSDNRADIISQMGGRLNVLWRDYQIIGFIAENPLLPLEPLASYGRVLATLRTISSHIDEILALQPAALAWKNDAGSQNIFPLLDSVFVHLETIDKLLVRIDPSLKRLVGANTSSGKMLAGSLASLHSFITHRDMWYAILGKNGPTRILLLNQNSDELRAGGGFPGTAFILEFDNGRLTRSQFSDIYTLDWQLKGYRPSPEGINQMRSLDYPGQPVEFEIRDANYYPLFADSAKKIDELSQIADIGKIDLVVGINQRLLEDIIKLVEPISVEGVAIPFDHNNINTILSLLVEAKISLVGLSVKEKEKSKRVDLLSETTESTELNRDGGQPKITPKSTVKILSEKLLDRLHATGKEKQALIIMLKNILDGEVVVGSPREDVQAALNDVGIFDTWQFASGDWLYPLFTSISKNKSDRFMERTFEIYQTSRCDRRVVLTQKHWFDMIEEAKVQKYAQQLGIVENLGTLFFVQGDGDNIQYLRYVLPPGTQLVESQGIEKPRLTESNERYTVLDGYKTTRPSATSTASFTYRLDTAHCSDSTYFFKQPGLRNTRVIIKKDNKSMYQKFYE